MIANLILRMSPYTEVPTPFIKDGMNEFERNTKRALDFVVAIVALIVFSPLFLICYIAVRKRRWRSRYIQAGAYRAIWTAIYDL